MTALKTDYSSKKERPQEKIGKNRRNYGRKNL